MQDYTYIPRGGGKTTRLIYISEFTGNPILVHSEESKQHLLDTAKRLNAKIPEPLCVAELMNHKRPLQGRPRSIYVDESKSVLARMLKEFGYDMEAVT